MQRIDTATAQKDKFGTGKNGFTNGNPQTGVPATDLDSAFFDSTQEEICSVIEFTGAELDPGKLDQLLTAIQAIVAGNASVSGALQKAQNLADLEDVATSRQNLELGDAATKNIGTTAGTVAAGDDARFGASITLEDIYLVGSEFSSYTDSRNPADILGFGTWSPVVGLIAGVGAATDSQGLTANYTAGYQAGSWRVQNGHIVAQNLDVALTMNPVDDHEHPLTVYWLNTSAQTAVIGAGASATVNGTTNSGGAGGHTPTGSGAVTIGSGTATDSAAFFSPYYGKYIWQRVA